MAKEAPTQSLEEVIEEKKAHRPTVKLKESPQFPHPPIASENTADTPHGEGKRGCWMAAWKTLKTPALILAIVAGTLEADKHYQLGKYYKDVKESGGNTLSAIGELADTVIPEPVEDSINETWEALLKYLD